MPYLSALLHAIGVKPRRKTDFEYEIAKRNFTAEQVNAMKADYLKVASSLDSVLRQPELEALLALPKGAEGLNAAIYKMLARCSCHPGKVQFQDIVVMKAKLESSSTQHLHDVFWDLLDAQGQGYAAPAMVEDVLDGLRRLALGDDNDGSVQHLEWRHAVVQGALFMSTSGGSPFQQFSQQLYKQWVKQAHCFLEPLQRVMSAFPRASTLSAKGSAVVANKLAAFAQHVSLPSLLVPKSVPLSGCLLTTEWSWTLSHVMPPSQRSKWKLLYSSRVHQRSLSTFLANTADNGPTLLLIKDTQGHVFGGYATDNWASHRSFYGSSASFIFSLQPRYIVHFASGVNNNIQWCNDADAAAPKGIGWGGHRGCYALFVDAGFTHGMSRHTETFKNANPVSAFGAFVVDVVECWSVDASSGTVGNGRSIDISASTVTSHPIV